MLNRLSIKLLAPTFFVGIFSIMAITLLVDSVSKFTVLILVSVMVIVQAIIGYLYTEKKLTQRLVMLQQFINQVASVDEAPSKLAKDNNQDDLAKVTNDLSTFIANLADVIREIRAESETLKQGSASLTIQMNDSGFSYFSARNQCFKYQSTYG